MARFEGTQLLLPVSTHLERYFSTGSKHSHTAQPQVHLARRPDGILLGHLSRKDALLSSLVAVVIVRRTKDTTATRTDCPPIFR